ncbi:MAG: hypothetical protein Q8N44_21680, partial [Rubrivivax sp.]|nr:hypothetical protein [Rubrivivax sp.]
MHSNPIPHRRHSAELKAKALTACNEPGASIAANIGYGRPGATAAEIEAAARKAQAHEFILG